MSERIELTDEQMRDVVLKEMSNAFSLYDRQAAREEKAVADAKLPARERREAEACARYSRRQAAHYQQAIDLLTAAPMPPKDEPR